VAVRLTSDRLWVSTLVVFKGADSDLSSPRLAGSPCRLPYTQLFLNLPPPGILFPHVAYNQESSPSRVLVRARPSELRRYAPPPSFRRQLTSDIPSCVAYPSRSLRRVGPFFVFLTLLATFYFPISACFYSPFERSTM